LLVRIKQIIIVINLHRQDNSRLFLRRFFFMPFKNLILFRTDRTNEIKFSIENQVSP